MTNALYKELSFGVIGAAMEVHKVIGPGFPEQVYQKALEHELSLRSIPFEPQQRIEVRYKGAFIAEYFLDLVVDCKIDVELKALSQLAPVHQAQVIPYLKASDLPLGLLFNFGETSLVYKRIIATVKEKSVDSTPCVF